MPGFPINGHILWLIKSKDFSEDDEVMICGGQRGVR